jgi:hypothetical protein
MSIKEEADDPFVASLERLSPLTAKHAFEGVDDQEKRQRLGSWISNVVDKKEDSVRRTRCEVLLKLWPNPHFQPFVTVNGAIDSMVKQVNLPRFQFMRLSNSTPGQLLLMECKSFLERSWGPASDCTLVEVFTVDTNRVYSKYAREWISVADACARLTPPTTLQVPSADHTHPN